KVELIEALAGQADRDSLIGQSFIRTPAEAHEIKRIAGWDTSGAGCVRFRGGSGSLARRWLAEQMHQDILLQVGIVHQFLYGVPSPVQEVVARRFTGRNGGDVEAGAQRHQQELAGSGRPSELI